MNPFRYSVALKADDAVAAGADRAAAFLAGGTTLLDLMKLHVLKPERLIDINRLPMAKIDADKAGLKIGAMARMSDVADDPSVRAAYPVIREALLESASPQLRNMASIGGNLLQRVRCSYFRDTTWPCNKREPGSGCSALDGENRMHAVLGTSEKCIATHPSDLAVALVALDAVVRLQGKDGERAVPVRDFHLLPGDTPHVENVLKPGELIVGVEVPASPLAARSHYLKVRDRASYEFALVSVAAALTVEGGKVTDCRVALGGVGTKPWRSPEAEAALKGQPAGEKAYRAAAEVALAGAKPRGHNKFKVELAKRAVVRALTTLEGRP
ncbi:MAG: FAD binding domain-containing protein [Gemmataceae bacterium]